jgi:pyruvate,orthophosphate dikinase
MSKWVYGFGNGSAEGDATLRELLGGKGAGLAEMSELGLPVPPGFTITTEVCRYFYAHDKSYPSDLHKRVETALQKIEKEVGARFGDVANPLLVSVRSGARASMPGMMDTVLNLGLNGETVEGLAKLSGDRRFAYDSYRRFIQMYANVVLGLSGYLFEDLMDTCKNERGVTLDTDLGADDLQELAGGFLAKVEEQSGAPFPEDVQEQLWGAIAAVFGSWNTERAVTYRRLNGIPSDWGTAVNIQAMVFGNMGDSCSTGVAFTRDPSTGENVFYGEYLVNAQGEDVVAGIRTPQCLTSSAKKAQGSKLPAMEEAMPEIFRQLDDVRHTLQAHYRDMQDVEFTVQNGKLWMLQTRAGKRTAAAAVKIAVDMVAEGLIDKATAVSRVDPAALDQLLHPALDPTAEKSVLATGLPASPGAASGRAVFSADEAEELAAMGTAVILVRTETSPEDIHGMHAARGILTTRGGMTSHAAVVARGMGRACVAGAGALAVDSQAKTMSVADTVVRSGDQITIDGGTGEVMLGLVPTIRPELASEFATLMEWADDIRRLKVRANAETPLDTRTAREFGAEGIGLCRTEHMFFDGDRIVAVREMIVAESQAGRRAALQKILPMQRADFIELFRIMKGTPVTVRLLDPPLHEFLPKGEAELSEVARAANLPMEQVRHRAAQLKEANPMLGHRGCRLAITYPEIYEMQARAIFEAALEVGREMQEEVILEIMVPLVATPQEFDILKSDIDRVAEEVAAEVGETPNYLVGTMIELPRAAICAGEIARKAEFFSFGTNDLTQTTFGLSRDDTASFLPQYERRGILPTDPFVSIDIDGVGTLVAMAAERGRAARADLKLGICGEHGGDPASIAFCEEVGLDYVSCSPYRVPVARLAAAQAALKAKG